MANSWLVISGEESEQPSALREVATAADGLGPRSLDQPAKMSK